MVEKIMKKLLAILSTIFLMCISSISAYATCSDLYSYGSISISGFDVYYWTSNSAGEIIQVVSPPNTYYTFPADTIFLRQINVYSQVNRMVAAKQYQFSGFFEFVNNQPNDLNFNFPTNFPAPVLIGDDGHEIGHCDLPTININNSVSRYYVGNDFYSYKSIPFSVQCHSNGFDRPVGMSFPMNFSSVYGPLNQYSFSVTPYLYSGYTYSNNEYDYNFCTLQEAIQNISFSDSGITGAINTGTQNIINNNNSNTQDIINNQDNNTQDIIDNNNNNTQQIVDQLTSESCSQVACSNLFHPQGTASGGSVTTVGDSYVEFTRRSNSIDNQIYFSDGYASVTRGKTYYYKLDCSSDLIFNIAFGGDGNMTQYLSCGSGSFVWNNSTVTRLNQLRYSNNRPEQSTTFRIDIYLSETDGDFCNYGTTIEECSGSNRLDNINDSINNVNDTLTDSDTSSAVSDFQSAINNFQQTDYGFSDFILLPVSFLQATLQSTCQPLVLSYPYLTNKTLELPCYEPLLSYHFDYLLGIIHVVSNALIGYYCILTLYRMTQDILNPNKDNLDVFEL